MAYDKVVDSAVLDAGLQTVADAIRAKSGTSDPLTFPDGMAAAVAAIVAGGGGGLPEGISAVASGTISPTSNITSNYTVTHNLGVRPNFTVLMLCDDAGTSNIKGTLVFQAMAHKAIKDTSGNVSYMRGMSVSLNTNGGVANNTINSNDMSYASETEAVLRPLSSYPLKAGCTYRWFCVASNDVE